jgi:hypothetical protein
MYNLANTTRTSTARSNAGLEPKYAGLVRVSTRGYQPATTQKQKDANILGSFYVDILGLGTFRVTDRNRKDGSSRFLTTESYKTEDKNGKEVYRQLFHMSDALQNTLLSQLENGLEMGSYLNVPSFGENELGEAGTSMCVALGVTGVDSFAFKDVGDKRIKGNLTLHTVFGDIRRVKMACTEIVDGAGATIGAVWDALDPAIYNPDAEEKRDKNRIVFRLSPALKAFACRWAHVHSNGDAPAASAAAETVDAPAVVDAY